MKLYMFYGHVIPERANVNISRITTKVEGADVAFTADVTIDILASQIIVSLQTETDIDVVDIKNIISLHVHTILDTYGYLKGFAYNLEITSMLDLTTGDKHVFGVDVVSITQDEKNSTFR